MYLSKHIRHEGLESSVVRDAGPFDRAFHADGAAQVEEICERQAIPALSRAGVSRHVPCGFGHEAQLDAVTIASMCDHAECLDIERITRRASPAYVYAI